jgi:hypothetical protein
MQALLKLASLGWPAKRIAAENGYASDLQR